MIKKRFYYRIYLKNVYGMLSERNFRIGIQVEGVNSSTIYENMQKEGL